jgi:hypothetical protein
MAHAQHAQERNNPRLPTELHMVSWRNLAGCVTHLTGGHPFSKPDAKHALCRIWTRAPGGLHSRRCNTHSSRSSASQGPSSRSLPSRSAGGPCVGTAGTPGSSEPPPTSHPCPPCTTPPWQRCLPRLRSSTRRLTQPQWLPCR